MEHFFDIQCIPERKTLQLDAVVKSSWKILGHYFYGGAQPPSVSLMSGDAVVIALFINGVQPLVVNGMQYVDESIAVVKEPIRASVKAAGGTQSYGSVFLELKK